MDSTALGNLCDSCICLRSTRSVANQSSGAAHADPAAWNSVRHPPHRYDGGDFRVCAIHGAADVQLESDAISASNGNYDSVEVF